MAKLSPVPMLQLFLPTLLPHSSLPTQSNSPLLPPTISGISTTLLTHVPDTTSLISITTDNRDQTALATPKPPPTMQQPTPTQPSPPNSLPLSLTPLSMPPTPATPTPLINLSLMERLIHNNTPAHAALWTLDALNRHHALHWTTTISNPTGHHPNLPTDSLPIHLATIQQCMLTLPDNRHHGFA